MSRLFSTFSSLAFCVIAGPALAQTTATELWAEWQQMAELGAQELSADVTETATGLVLDNYTATSSQEGVDLLAEIERIEMVENGDGTVTTTFSSPYRVLTTIEDGFGGPPETIEMIVGYEDLQVITSGRAGARIHETSASLVTVTEGEMSGEAGGMPIVDIDVTLTDIDATYQVFGTDPETMRFSSESTLGGIALSVEIAPPPPETGSLKFGMTITDITGASDGTIYGFATFGQTGGGLPPGSAIDATLSYAAMAVEVAFEDGPDTFESLYTNGGGSGEIGFSDTAFSLSTQATDVAATSVVTGVPFPISYTAAQTGLSFEVPLAAGDEPQDFSMSLALRGISLDEALWGLFDPGAAIPRDPASLVIDTSGLIQIFVDLTSLDPDEMTAPPGEIRAFRVDDLLFSVGGAELTGTADLTFAPNAIVPIPEGSADLRLSGSNALMDAVVAAGLVPAEQAAFARGMLNVFAVPGAEPDTLESTIAFGADGSVTANGVPLQ